MTFGIKIENPCNEEISSMVRKLRDEGYSNQVLISQDAGWYSVEEPDGGELTPYTPLLESFVPTLKAEGFNQSEIGHQS